MPTTSATSAFGIHTPERHPLESFADYRERRRQSNAVGKSMADGVPLSAVRMATLGKGPGRVDRERARVEAKRPAISGPKPLNERVRKQHKHPLRDEHGAYTLVGGTYTVEGGTPGKSEHVIAAGVGDGEGFYTARRIWLGGISAQRGF